MTSGAPDGWNGGADRRIRSGRPGVWVRLRPVRNRRRHRADSAVRLSVAAVRRGAFGHDARGGGDVDGAGATERDRFHAQATRARESRPVVLPDLGRRNPDRRPDRDRAAALCVHRTSASDLCALHGDGRRLRGLPEGPSGDRACATARRDKAGCGVGDRLPCRVDRHRRRHARDSDPAGLQHENGSRDRHLVGDRTGDRRCRHDRRCRGRLACPWAACLLSGLR